MSRTSIVTAAIAAIALGVGIAGTAVYMNLTDKPAVSTSGPAVLQSPSTSPAVDPYEVYLKLAPKNAPKLSRDEAQARALLGCGQKWAPGTVDAALAKAYAELCEGR